MTWLRNVGAYGADARSTSTTVDADTSPSRAVMMVRPSPTAATTPAASTVATFGFEDANVDVPVRLPVYVVPARASTMSC